MHGFFRVAVGVPKIKVADVPYNTAQMIQLITRARDLGAGMLVLPELCLTGASCGDLFRQNALIQSVTAAIPALVKACDGLDCVVFGAPLAAASRLFHCAVIVTRGGRVYAYPKSRLTLSEQRWFSDGAFLSGGAAGRHTAQSSGGCADDCAAGSLSAYYAGTAIPFLNAAPPALVFDGGETAVGLRIVFGDDYAFADTEAGIVAHLSAVPETLGKAKARRLLVSAASKTTHSAYLYACAGYGESTTDAVYGGHSLIYEDGAVLAESERFSGESHLICRDIDLEKILWAKRAGAEAQSAAPYQAPRVIFPAAETQRLPLRRPLPANPFLPETEAEQDAWCEEILQMQAAGLIKRMDHLGCKKLILGVSGGLDSTLALLVCWFALRKTGGDLSDLITVTMPGYGTSSKTRQNAVRLIRLLGATFREIPIAAACDRHFLDIGHDKRQDTAFENAQARERTQILLDIANMEQGIVVGTGDFTELALGFATYNGDHMSNYCVNGNVPKTVVRAVVAMVRRRFFSSAADTETQAVLLDILQTPISPELLPPDGSGEIAQKTEAIVGSYELNDFFLYFVLKYGFAPSKILFLAAQTFGEAYETAELTQRLNAFYRRFITQQFKRSCMPDGPAVYDFSLSPRCGTVMPSDASFAVWSGTV